MQSAIRSILVPVQADAASLSFAGQAAEIAKEHKAELHLLQTAGMYECRNHFLNLFTFAGVKDYHRLTNEKTALLNTWKKWLEKEYSIPVSITVDWGRWKDTLLKHAERSGADLIVLREEPAHMKQRWFRITELEGILEESPCQVITILGGHKGMQEWKQVVMPVTDDIPEKRIYTITEIAKKLKLKIHLVTVAGSERKNRQSDFYFLTETLKRLKPAGNIQVECRCLNENSNPSHSFLHYAQAVGADLLMTNMRAATMQDHKPNEAFHFMNYNL
jgi:hypothetical protein